MSRFLILLYYFCTFEDAWIFARSRLNVDRKPLGRADALEIQMLRVLTPLLDEFAGDRVAIRHACPPRWLFALDTALATPDFVLDAAGPIGELVRQWALQGSKNFHLNATSTPVTPMRPKSADSSEAAA
jgi:hypothetical protein